MILKKAGNVIILTFFILLIILSALVWLTTYHPAETSVEEPVCAISAPRLKSGETVKVMSYNVQYMAGKNYVFYYDLPDFSGPDERPSPEDITATFGNIADIIKDEDPDIILLQEIDDGAARTDCEDQTARLMSLLPGHYRCHASTFYWKAAFVPHPRIMGSVGMKLTTISKYEISSATRRSLPPVPGNIISKQFKLKRAILETRLPIEGGGELSVLNLHLEAFTEGSDVMEKQINTLEELLQKNDREGRPWIAGGDFNLLPPGQYKYLREYQKYYYNPETEMKGIYDRYTVVPAFKDAAGPDREKWFTHFPNAPGAKGPDKTIDYIVVSSRVNVTDARVRRRDDTLSASDHLPVIAEVSITP